METNIKTKSLDALIAELDLNERLPPSMRCDDYIRDLRTRIAAAESKAGAAATADKYIGPDGSAGANRLPVLAAEIKELFDEQRAHEKKAKEHDSKAARHVGLRDEELKAAQECKKNIARRLIEVREATDHGEWLAWLHNNCAMSKSTAYNYIRLVKKETEIAAKLPTGASVGTLGVNAQLKTVATPRVKPEPAPTREPPQQQQPMPEPRQLDIEEAIETAADGDYDEIPEDEWEAIDECRVYIKYIFSDVEDAVKNLETYKRAMALEHRFAGDAVMSAKFKKFKDEVLSETNNVIGKIPDILKTIEAIHELLKALRAAA